MASKFPPFLASGVKVPFVAEYTPEVAAVYGPHSMVFYDVADNFIKLCGADPALILGLSLGGAVGGKNLTPTGKIPVWVLDTDDLVGLSSPTTPTEAHVGDSFGVLMDATTGYWQADPTDAGNPRVLCARVDIPNGIFYCRFIAANLQFDAIAS
jgi:hypothetical protein